MKRSSVGDIQDLPQTHSTYLQDLQHLILATEQAAKPSITSSKQCDELRSAKAMATAAHLRQSEISPDKMGPGSTLPLSPNESPNDGSLPQGFDELVHHNNASFFPRDHAAIEVASIHGASQPSSRISTPAPHPAMSPHFNQYGLPPHQQQPEYTNDYTYQSQDAYDSPEGAYPDVPADVSTPASMYGFLAHPRQSRSHIPLQRHRHRSGRICSACVMARSLDQRMRCPGLLRRNLVSRSQRKRRVGRGWIKTRCILRNPSARWVRNGSSP